MSLSSALVEDDWLKPLVEDLGLSGEEELKWDDLAFLDLATPANKSKCVNPDLFGDTGCLFDGDYYFEKGGGSAGALLDLFPSSGSQPETEQLLQELIQQPLERPPPELTTKKDENTGITLGGIKTLNATDTIPKDALAKISITRNNTAKTTTISVLTPDGSSGRSYQVNTLNVLEAIEALKPLNLDKLILSGNNKLKKAETTTVATSDSTNRVELDVNESQSSSPVLVEKVEDSSTAGFIKHFHSLGISISSLYRIKSSPRYWICPFNDCKKGFSKLSLLKVHLYEHYGIRPYECPVPGCKWSFKTPFKLKRHSKTHSKESSCKKRFVCNICSTGFNTARNLGVHLKSHEPSVTTSGPSLINDRKLDSFLYDL